MRAVFEGQSAHAAGLQAGDIIVRVAGVDVASQSLGEAVSRITGPAGTSVRIEVVRGGGRRVFDVTRRAGPEFDRAVTAWWGWFSP